MIVTGIERRKNHPDRYSIFVDGEFTLGVRSEVLLAAGLREGDTLTPDRIEALRNEEELGAARSTAARYLGRRRRTEWEIRRRLTSREFPPAVINRVVGELVSSGQLNDREYVLAFVHDAQLRKPSGKRMLSVKLRRKGLSREFLAEVLPSAIGPEEEAELALRSARGYISKLHRRALAGKVFAPGKMRGMLRVYLNGRGFDSAAISEAMKGLTDDPDDGE